MGFHKEHKSNYVLESYSRFFNGERDLEHK